MKRSKFIELFNSENGFIKIEFKNNVIDYNLYTALYIQSNYEYILREFNLNNIRLNNIKLNVTSYSGYIEVNLNEIYDHIINEHNILGQNKKLYRIESQDNLGIYNAGGFYLLSEKSNNKRKDPAYDDNLNHIFDSINDYSASGYKTKWNFAFENIEDLKEWISDKETYINLRDDNRHFHIKEIYVPENMIIVGNKQVIFQSEKIRTINKIEIKIFEKDFNLKILSHYNRLIQ